MNKIVTSLLDHVWNLKILTGYRSKICRWGISLTTTMTAYQGAVMAGELTTPAVPPEVMMICGVISTFLAGKYKKFVKEHKGK